MNFASALLKRYAPPRWALFFEVPDSTGFAKTRTADAVAMGLWPSVGLDLVGFEFKSVRSDWLSELKRPEKSDAIGRYCDQWYLVCPPDVAKPDEIPSAWGWLVFGKGGLKVAKKCPERTVAPIDRRFLASLLRSGSREDEFQEKVQAAVASALAEREAQAERHQAPELVQARRERDAWKKAVETFEAKSGVRISEWNAGNVGEQFRHFTQFSADCRDVAKLIEKMDYIRAQHMDQTYLLERQIDALRKAFLEPVEAETSNKCGPLEGLKSSVQMELERGRA